MPDSGAGSPGGGRTDVAAFCNGTFRHEDSPAPQHEMFRSAAAVSEPKSALNITYWLCSRKVLKIPLTAGGASVASYGATPPAARSCCMEPGEAQLHEGASEPAVDICCLWPVRDRGLPLRQGICRLCRSKTIRSAQHYQHGSMAAWHQSILLMKSSTKSRRARLRRRRETCGPEHRIWPADIFKRKMPRWMRGRSRIWMCG